ncbi:TetR/AcrR family transcriptional regulator [Streptacidiphilus fuscans]|uniref:TetR/AcrR family transcriptional regulator n=1 Tax=Streptacidiphilus fuscans TaxID=2789292 RepID=A0A931B5W9_9ACTN|nr:TetR/AcrR family transcriptional regulator [Streptacidiphilus fuscans]MBF9069586.1 TetR/AcrR family transcriptional regulator [Streptacidiphilus fuscans]
MTSPSERPAPAYPAAEARSLPVLPVLLDGEPVERAERADAARNRAKLLDAASSLIRDRGAEHLTMEGVASAANVGKGTVFRRFGDRAGLLFAVIDKTEKEFQESFLFGPPPVGPGAPPVERLEAFGVTALRHLRCNMNLYVEADRNADRRYTSPARVVRERHITLLLRAAGVTGDLELLSNTLLSFLDPMATEHLLANRGRTLAELEGGWRDLVQRIARPA